MTNCHEAKCCGSACLQWQQQHVPLQANGEAVRILPQLRLVTLVRDAVQIGPALSALDADVSYQAGPVQRAKDYKKAAQHSAAAQEARGMLGEPLRLFPSHCCGQTNSACILRS